MHLSLINLIEMLLNKGGEIVIIREKDYLKHYGVLGMKWGVRKNPERAYEKSKTKAVRLKAKSTKADLKLAKTQHKLDKYQRKSNNVLEGDENPYSDKIKNLQNKSKKQTEKANKLSEKHTKWVDAMEENFGNIDVDSIPEQDITRGKEYINYILAIQSSKVSNRYMNALR